MPGCPRSHARDNHSNPLNLGQVFRQSWSSLPSKIWLPGIVFRTFRKSETPRQREIPCCLSLSLSLVSVRSLLATQDSSYKLEMWKLSMKELDWTRASTVVLDMKSQIRHFREQLGFEVPPPLNLSSSSVQLELAISLNSCNLS